MKKHYRPEPSWYKSRPIIFFYLIYLIVLNYIKGQNNQFHILICPHCGIPFLTSKSNSNRSDILCHFGCRQIQKKLKARERSKKYSQTPHGSQKKKEFNRARYDQTITPKNNIEKKQHPDDWYHYLQFFLYAITGEKIDLAEIYEIIEKQRSRSLDSS